MPPGRRPRPAADPARDVTHAERRHQLFRAPALPLRDLERRGGVDHRCVVDRDHEQRATHRQHPDHLRESSYSARSTACDRRRRGSRARAETYTVAGSEACRQTMSRVAWRTVGHPLGRGDVMSNGKARPPLGDSDPVHRPASVASERVARRAAGTIERTGGARVTVWFTVKLDDRPGSLARVATALGERGVNITGIVGVAEDTDGALMLDDVATRRRRARRSTALGARRSRSTTRPAASSPARCPSTTSGPARPAAARSADAARQRPPPTAAIRVRRRRSRRGDLGDHRAGRRRSAAGSGRWRRSARSRATRRLTEIELEVEGVDRGGARRRSPRHSPDVRSIHLTRALDTVFGKRVIVVGGGAQVAQVALGAVSEADRHNLRGERISVDTIPLVGEAAHRGRRPGRRGPAAGAAARPGRLDHGRRHQRRGRRAPGASASRSSR